MPHTDDQSGITIVEIMVSLAILGLVLTTFFMVITNGLQSHSDAGARQNSSQLSTEVIEGLRTVAPAEVAMYVPATADSESFDPTSVSCGGVQGEYDPDGDGPLGCEEVVVADLGAIRVAEPYNFTSPEGITVTTIATLAEDPEVPDNTVRVTVVTEYQIAGDAGLIRRSSLFSEVPRG